MFGQLASQLGESGKGYVTAGTGVREDGAKRFYANRDEPRLPAALNGIVAISGLDDYGEHHSHLRSNAIIHKRFSWAPADLAVGYDLNALYGQGLDGSGETIAQFSCLS